VLALREVAAGLIGYSILDEVEIRKSSDEELSELIQADALRKARQDLSITEAMDADLIEEDDDEDPKARKADADDEEDGGKEAPQGEEEE
jgi:hypothetical protein